MEQIRDPSISCKIIISAGVGTCVSAMSVLFSSGRAGVAESAPCVGRLFKTSSKPTDRNWNVERKFYTVKPVIFNKTRTLPFECTGCYGQLWPGGHDLSLKSQNNFKHWSYQDEAKAIQSCKKKFHKCKQAISSEPSIKISPSASRGSFCTNNLASSIHCNVHICTFVIFMEINVLTNVKWALWQTSFWDLPTQKWRPIQCRSRYQISQH